MLKQRIITALVLLPLVLGAIAGLPTKWLAFVFSGVILVAAHEWLMLTKVGMPKAWIAALVGLLFLVSSTWLLPWIWWPVLATCAWWVWMTRWIVTYPRGFDATHPPRWLLAGAGMLVITGTIAAVALLHGAPQGGWRLIFALFVVWAADVGAYFAGRGFGRHKLAPNVSPGKTWEGVAGGVLLAWLIAGFAGTWLFRLEGTAWIGFLAMCTAVVAFSIVGDLGESILKRQAGAKDSGTLLPGHGGLLDRIDSVLAALPAMALGLRGLGL